MSLRELTKSNVEVFEEITLKSSQHCSPLYPGTIMVQPSDMIFLTLRNTNKVIYIVNNARLQLLI